MLDALTTGEFKVQFVSRLVLNPIFEENEFWKGKLDYIGMNHYNKAVIGIDFSSADYLYIDMKHPVTENPKASTMKWELDGTSMLYALRKMSSYNLPIFITESGCDDNGLEEDVKRRQFMIQSLSCVSQAIYNENINVLGFCVWSLVSNYEWGDVNDKSGNFVHDGFAPRFGLFDLNYQILKQQFDEGRYDEPNFVDKSRIPTGSAHLYKRIIERQKKFINKK